MPIWSFVLLVKSNSDKFCEYFCPVHLIINTHCDFNLSQGLSLWASYWYELPASVSVAQESTKKIKHALHCLAFFLAFSTSSGINLMTTYTRLINLSVLCVLIKVCGCCFYIQCVLVNFSVFWSRVSVFWSSLVCFDLELVCFGQV